jgi:hypothetical protein
MGISNYEVISMDEKFVNAASELDYANLSKDQEARLRELEKEFNNEFGTAYYFMVTKRDRH